MSDTASVRSTDDLLSDDSSFYGDDNTKRYYEKELGAYDVLDFWEAHAVNHQCILAQQEKAETIPTRIKRQASEEVKAEPGTKRRKMETTDRADIPEAEGKDKQAVVDQIKDNPRKSPPYFHNQHEGLTSGKQTNETVDAFINRLRPSISTFADAPDGGSWIWCANPHHERISQNVGEFSQRGYQLLEDFLPQRSTLEDQNPNKPAGSITRMLSSKREFLEQQIVELAKRCKVLTGKWMLFPTPEDVDAVWHTVAQATWDGLLGCDSKVALNMDTSEQKTERLICIYTRDFTDKENVKHVLQEMKRLGLVQDHAMAKPIYYKCDAYTHLNLMSGNEFKIKASSYNSRDMFKETGGGGGRKKRWGS